MFYFKSIHRHQFYLKNNKKIYILLIKSFQWKASIPNTKQKHSKNIKQNQSFGRGSYPWLVPTAASLSTFAPRVDNQESWPATMSGDSRRDAHSANTARDDTQIRLCRSDEDWAPTIQDAGRCGFRCRAEFLPRYFAHVTSAFDCMALGVLYWDFVMYSQIFHHGIYGCSDSSSRFMFVETPTRKFVFGIQSNFCYETKINT